MTSLFIWSDSTPDMDKLTAALRSLNLEFKVDRPQKAFPACSKRVLAVGSKPPFLVDYAYADDWNDPHLAMKLAWVLETRQVSSGPVLIADQLSEIMGAPVRELDRREIHREAIAHGGFGKMMGFDKKRPKFEEVEEE